MNAKSRFVNWHSWGWIVSTLLGLWLVLPSSSAAAAIYFVDANDPYARDSNPGTETLPFKTINKAAALVNAGDTVFIKAGVYRETVILSRSGTSTTGTGRTGPVTITSPITIAVYPGHEGKAIINAAEPVTNWRKCTGPQECAGNPNWGHIYWADVTALVQSHPDKSFAVRQVFQHGVRLPPSRYPNTGWSYPTAVANPRTTFSDSTLAKPSTYFNGAVCHIKTAMWRIDQIPITNSYGTTIVLATNPWYDLSTRFGYYITSVVGEINEEGEWAYDRALQRLYLWPKGTVPEEVEFTYRQYCLWAYRGVSYNIVRGLTMRYPYEYGVYFYSANNMTVENNTIEHAYSFGIHLQATDGPCDNHQIVRNTIKYSCYRGINVGGGSSSCNIEGNYVYATGVEQFGGDLMHGPSEAIYINGAYHRIYNNRIDRAGHVGLYLDGKTSSRDVSYNYITNTGLALSDTGGLYTGGFSDVSEKDHIHHNVIEDSLGCRIMDRLYDTGRPPTLETYAGDSSGIYVDEQGNNRVLEDNTVIGCRMAGIFFHGASANVVQRNTLYGNGVTQMWFAGKIRTGMALTNDTVLDNILFATRSEQKTFYLTLEYDNMHFGRSDRNYFYHPYDSLHIFLSRYPASGGVLQENLTLARWRALSGYDLQSKDFSFLERRDGMPLAEPRESRIVYNPTLDVMTVDLEGKTYCDVQGNLVSGEVTLQPFESKILIAADFQPSASVLP
jgi:parallel beta-helix repeat protein